MRVHFLGGADEVGASCVLVEAGGRRVLVDAGVRMGAAARDRLPHLAPITDLGGLDAILLTHAHLDHSGALPLVHESFRSVPVITTAPTLSLLRVLLLDAIKVMAMKEAQEDEVPLYPRESVEALLARAVGVRFLEPVPIFGGELRATFFPAGHVLGAAAIGLEHAEGAVLISGDVSMTDQLTVPGMPRPAFAPDLLVCESTYGARLHASRRAEETRLAAAVAEVLDGGGTVLIPAFALGRAQEVILVLRKALARVAPEVKVYIDGMVRAIDAVYSSHPEALSPTLRDRASKGRGLFTTADGRVRDVGHPAEREAIVEGGPAVIVSSSGMLSGGPSTWYAARLAGAEGNLIAITGYQDEEAPGRRLQELADGERRDLVIGGATVTVRCRVETYGLSAHADAQELAGLAAALRPGAVALVHGDGDARLGLAKTMADRGVGELHLPAAGDSVEVRRRARRGARRAVRGVGAGRPFDDDALAELHKHLWSEPRAAKRPLTVHELAERWFGSDDVPVDLAPVYAVLEAAGQRWFAPDGKRPFLYRWVDPSTVSEAAEDDADEGRMEQNAALALVDELLGAGAGLSKRGADRGRWTLRLSFDFPDVARQRHQATFEELERRTGWAVEVHPEPNLAAVGALLTRRVAPVKPPSVLKDERRVKVKVATLPPPAEAEEICRWFEQETGFALELEKAGEGTSSAKRAFDAEGRMEVNLAFGAIGRAFAGEPHRPTRKSKRTDPERGPYLELSFISLEVGLRYEELLDQLEDETGWRIEIADRVDQGAVLAAARDLVPSTWAVRKGPGLDVAGLKVIYRMEHAPPEEEVEEVSRELEERTGFLLELK